MTNPLNTGATFNQSVARQLPWMLSKAGVGIAYARIRYTGSAWEVTSSVSNVGFSSPTWSSTKLTVAMSDFTDTPTVIVSRAANNAYLVSAAATSTTNIDVTFEDFDGTDITSEGTAMDFHIIALGVTV